MSSRSGVDCQTSALRYLLEHGRLTIRDYRELCTGSNRRSLQRDLKGLLEKDLARNPESPQPIPICTVVDPQERPRRAERAERHRELDKGSR